MSEQVVAHEGDDQASERDRPVATAPRSDAAVVLGCYLALGVLGGLLWWLLTEPAYFTVDDDGGLGMGELELSRRFSADGWFVVVSAVLGLLAGGALTWWRSRDLLLTAGLVLAGSVLAAVVMTQLGGVLGPPDPGTVAADAAPGQRVPTQLEVTATVAYLVWPIGSLAGALMVLWSPSADVRV